jgi:hypothetical protein
VQSQQPPPFLANATHVLHNRGLAVCWDAGGAQVVAGVPAVLTGAWGRTNSVQSVSAACTEAPPVAPDSARHQRRAHAARHPTTLTHRRQGLTGSRPAACSCLGGLGLPTGDARGVVTAGDCVVARPAGWRRRPLRCHTAAPAPVTNTCWRGASSAASHRARAVQLDHGTC